MTTPQGPGGPHQGYPQGTPPQGPPNGPARHIPPTAPMQAAQPPGYPPNPQYPTTPSGYGSPAPERGVNGVWVLGLVSVIATVLGLTISEDGANAWHSVHAWGGLAIAGAVLTLAPAAARSLNLTPQRAWQLAACGAGALILFWVLFVLPDAGSNTSLLTTIGAAAGVIAVWMAPERENGRTTQPPGPSGNTW